MSVLKTYTMKLISMTDFVLERNQPMQNGLVRRVNSEYHKIIHYANFLKQPLTLGMFVPCDKDMNFFEEPKFPHLGSENQDEYIKNYQTKIKEYQEAKEHVLFDGFCFNDYFEFVTNGKISIDKNDMSSTLIEQLVGSELLLTESAKKQIGL